MHNYTIVNLVSFNSEITTFIPSYGIMAKTTPFSGRIELLIDPSVSAEGCTADLSLKREILKTLFERYELC